MDLKSFVQHTKPPDVNNVKVVIQNLTFKNNKHAQTLEGKIPFPQILLFPIC